MIIFKGADYYKLIILNRIICEKKGEIKMSLIKIKNDVELKKAQELLQAAGIEMETVTAYQEMCQEEAEYQAAIFQEKTGRVPEALFDQFQETLQSFLEDSDLLDYNYIRTLTQDALDEVLEKNN